MQSIPFLHWAGGKGWAVELLSSLAPPKIDRYFEPFLGAGALFFHLKPKVAYISDINADLINAYIAIRDDHISLINLLEAHVAPLTELLRFPKDYPIRKDHNNYYYRLRDCYNNNGSVGTQRAADLIALNRTCYNGLYRVNPKGKFNVPLGYFPSHRNIYDSDNLENISKILCNPDVMIKCCDYKEILNHVKEGDFVYFDPPYHAKSSTAYFTGYTVGNFLEAEQKQLADIFKQLDEIQCNLMLTNSDTQLIRDLYSNYTIIEARSLRRINSDISKRGNHTDLIIRNYDNNKK